MKTKTKETVTELSNDEIENLPTPVREYYWALTYGIFKIEHPKAGPDNLRTFKAIVAKQEKERKVYSEWLEKTKNLDIDTTYEKKIISALENKFHDTLLKKSKKCIESTQRQIKKCKDILS